MEILLIVVLALVLFGGNKLAGVGKALGQSIKEFKKEVKRESGLDEVEKEIKTMEHKIDEGVRSMDIRPELQKTQLSINKELNSIKKDVSFKDFKSNIGGK